MENITIASILKESKHRIGFVKSKKFKKNLRYKETGPNFQVITEEPTQDSMDATASPVRQIRNPYITIDYKNPSLPSISQIMDSYEDEMPIFGKNSKSVDLSTNQASRGTLALNQDLEAHQTQYLDQPQLSESI